jgi:MinD superfamily P-loop ATPase
MPELPMVDVARCTGCGACVLVCPTNCLEQLGRQPWLPRPGHCLSCTLCALVCPTRAIKMLDEDT